MVDDNVYVPCRLGAYYAGIPPAVVQSRHPKCC